MFDLNLMKDWECALKIGFYIPIWLISFLGNSFVFYLMCTNRFLRTSINIFIWNLASADLASILLFPWINLCSDLYQMYILGAVRYTYYNIRRLNKCGCLNPSWKKTKNSVTGDLSVGWLSPW